MNNVTSGISYTGIDNVSSIVSCGRMLYYQTGSSVKSIDTSDNSKDTYLSHGTLIGAGYGMLVFKVSKENYIVSDLATTNEYERISDIRIKCNSLGHIICYTSNSVKVYNTKTNTITSLDTFSHHISRVCVSYINVAVINTRGDVCLFTLKGGNNDYVRIERITEHLDCADIANNSRLSRLYVFDDSYVAVVKNSLVANINGRYRKFSNFNNDVGVTGMKIPIIITDDNRIMIFIRDDYKYLELCSISAASC